VFILVDDDHLDINESIGWHVLTGPSNGRGSVSKTTGAPYPEHNAATTRNGSEFMSAS
jgi:hypothetical protein